MWCLSEWAFIPQVKQAERKVLLEHKHKIKNMLWDFWMKYAEVFSFQKTIIEHYYFYGHFDVLYFKSRQ